MALSGVVKRDTRKRRRTSSNKCGGNMGRFSGPQLSTLSHEEGTPWYKVWHDKYRTEPKPIIPDGLIQEYYQDLWQNSNGHQ